MSWQKAGTRIFAETRRSSNVLATLLGRHYRALVPDRNLVVNAAQENGEVGVDAAHSAAAVAKAAAGL